MCNNKNNGGNCIADILRVILVLQQNACPEGCLDSCDRPMLGGGTNCLICNTRPVMLYTCCGNGVPWSMPTTKDTTTACSTAGTTCSSVFRVEKVEGNCATFRVLQDNPDPNSLRCLSDTYVDCV